jgi:hypothetical protein
MERKFENNRFSIEYFPFEKRVDFFIKNEEISKEDVIEMHIQTLQLTKGAEHTNLFRAQEFFSINAEARAEGEKPHYADGLIAQAFVVKNLAQRLIGNFIIKVNKPARLTRMFTDYEEATRWLADKRDSFSGSEKISGTNTLNV